jgi:hypothetical protein
MQESRRNPTRGVTGYSRSETLDVHDDPEQGINDAELQRLEEQRQYAFKPKGQDESKGTPAKPIDTSRGLQEIAPGEKSKIPKASPGKHRKRRWSS